MNSPNLNLIAPTIQYRDSFLEGLSALRDEGLEHYQHADIEAIARDFEDYVNQQLRHATDPIPPYVPSTELWAIVNDTYVGSVSIRHRLNIPLKILGGHIGYDVVPGHRRKGYASEMLRQAIPIARSLGIQEILITCDDDNVASIRVIEKHGGVLRDKKPLPWPPETLKRYYLINVLSS